MGPGHGGAGRDGDGVLDRLVDGPARATYAVALAAVVVPGLAGMVSGRADRLLKALRARADAAERARASAENEARTQERSRIAGEMHDLVGHRLSLASLHVGGLELALPKAAPALRPDAAVVRGTIKDALRGLRQALGLTWRCRSENATLHLVASSNQK
ncbi:histidine kinase [Streptomyces atratus]|uniref:histidine kinase n=1 Tax=Streptomyces atratus TaxID=1893 RepID=UPI00369631D9